MALLCACDHKVLETLCPSEGAGDPSRTTAGTAWPREAFTRPTSFASRAMSPSPHTRRRSAHQEYPDSERERLPADTSGRVPRRARAGRRPAYSQGGSIGPAASCGVRSAEASRSACASFVATACVSGITLSSENCLRFAADSAQSVTFGGRCPDRPQNRASFSRPYTSVPWRVLFSAA